MQAAKDVILHERCVILHGNSRGCNITRISCNITSYFYILRFLTLLFVISVILDMSFSLVFPLFGVLTVMPSKISTFADIQNRKKKKFLFKFKMKRTFIKMHQMYHSGVLLCTPDLEEYVLYYIAKL